MLNLSLILDAAPTPAILLFFLLALAGFIVVIGLVTISIIFIVKAIKKKNQNNLLDNRRED